MPLLGKAEKAELETLILARLVAHYEAEGPGALLVEGLRIVADGRGVQLDHGQTPEPLAAIEVRLLFTALCYVTAGTLAMPRESLGALAMEATSSLAQQINRLVPE